MNIFNQYIEKIDESKTGNVGIGNIKVPYEKFNGNLSFTFTPENAIKLAKAIKKSKEFKNKFSKSEKKAYKNGYYAGEKGARFFRYINDLADGKTDGEEVIIDQSLEGRNFPGGTKFFKIV